MPNQIDEFRKAERELQQAQANFDAADSDHIEIAIYKLRNAEKRYGNALRALRGGGEKSA